MTATYTCRCSLCGRHWSVTLPAETVVPPACTCGSRLVSYRRSS